MAKVNYSRLICLIHGPIQVWFDEKRMQPGELWWRRPTDKFFREKLAGPGVNVAGRLVSVEEILVPALPPGLSGELRTRWQTVVQIGRVRYMTRFPFRPTYRTDPFDERTETDIEEGSDVIVRSRAFVSPSGKSCWGLAIEKRKD